MHLVTRCPGGRLAGVLLTLSLGMAVGLPVHADQPVPKSLLATEAYLTPAKEIADAVLATRDEVHTLSNISPDGKKFVIVKNDGMPPLSARRPPYGPAWRSSVRSHGRQIAGPVDPQRCRLRHLLPRRQANRAGADTRSSQSEYSHLVARRYAFGVLRSLRHRHLYLHRRCRHRILEATFGGSHLGHHGQFFPVVQRREEDSNRFAAQ